MLIRDIARICHEANRAYCGVLEDYSQSTWLAAPDWQRKSAIDGVIYVLDSLRAGKVVSPSRSHENWMREKESEGWIYGPVKDISTKQHPCFVPYDSLPPNQKAKDHLFISIVTALYESGMTKQEAHEHITTSQ